MNSPRVTGPRFFGRKRGRNLSRWTLAVVLKASLCWTSVLLAQAPPQPKESHVNVDRTIAGLTVEDCTRLIKSDQAELRRRGAATLAQYGSAAVGPLSDALQSPDAAVRTWAARGLRLDEQDAAWTAELRDAAAASLRRALRDPSPSVQIAAAGALVAHQTDVEAALQALGQALDSPIAGLRVESMTELDRAGQSARPLLARIAAAEDVPQHGDYVKRLSQRIVGRLQSSK
ncbi:MAG: hypothetical protein U0939_24970 [Pirellulales bacterium]